MDKERLLELAGVPLNEASDEVTVTWPREIAQDVQSALEMMYDLQRKEGEEDNLRLSANIKTASQILDDSL
jgi:hypothetical protein